MRKYSVIILLAAGSLMAGGGSAVCFAAEDANPKAASAPGALPQPSQRKMQQLSQKKKHQLSQRKMHRMQRASSHKPGQPVSAAEPAQGRTDEAPAPSQRSMRQKLREARPSQAPASAPPESR